MYKLIILLATCGLISTNNYVSVFDEPVVWSKWDSLNLMLCEATPDDQESVFNL